MRCAAHTARVCPHTHQRFPFPSAAKFHFPVPRKSRPAPPVLAGGQPPKRSFSSLRLPRQGKRREGEGKRKGRETHRTTTCPAAARPVSVSFPGSAGRRQARLCPPRPARPPARPSARVSRGFRLGAMATLESLGLVGTIAEGDVVPVDSESGDSEDEEVGRAGGSGGPGRRGGSGRGPLHGALHGCSRRSRAGLPAPGGGDPPAGISASTSCSGRRRPAGRMPGRRRCGSSAPR